MMNDWDRRIGWAFGLVADSVVERQEALQSLRQSREDWREALSRYNEVWNKPDHPKFRARVDAFSRAHDLTFPHALWRRYPEPLARWGGLPYMVLYLRWEALHPDEWLTFNSSWGSKVSILRSLSRSSEQLPPAVVDELEDLVMMAVHREYRCEDVGYARLARTISSPSLRARLSQTAQISEHTAGRHAAYLLWLLKDPTLPHPKRTQWHAWLRQDGAATDQQWRN